MEHKLNFLAKNGEGFEYPKFYHELDFLEGYVIIVDYIVCCESNSLVKRVELSRGF